MKNLWTHPGTALWALILSIALLHACGSPATPVEPREVLVIPVNVGERLGSWHGNLSPGDYDIWLHYRGSYNDRAKVCFMLKVTGEGVREEELKGWLADVIAQKTGRFLPATAAHSDGFERPLGKTLKIRGEAPVLLEGMIFLGPGSQVRMEEVRLVLKSTSPDAQATAS